VPGPFHGTATWIQKWFSKAEAEVEAKGVVTEIVTRAQKRNDPLDLDPEAV
jgi:hypothetical protein